MQLHFKIYEYMAAGLPVLSSLTGETEELLQENQCGITYTPESAASFLAALTFLTANPSLARKMGISGRRLLEEQYSTEQIYPKLVDFLEALAGAHDTTPLGAQALH